LVSSKAIRVDARRPAPIDLTESKPAAAIIDETTDLERGEVFMDDVPAMRPA
jgi:hypothetical protein